MRRILKDSGKCICRFLIGFWDEMRVDVKGRARISMTQSPGDGAHVHAGGKKARRHVMPEIMEANARHTGLPTDPPECSGGRIGVPW